MVGNGDIIKRRGKASTTSGRSWIRIARIPIGLRDDVI